MPVNCAAELRKRSPSILPANKGNVLRKAKVLLCSPSPPWPHEKSQPLSCPSRLTFRGQGCSLPQKQGVLPESLWPGCPSSAALAVGMSPAWELQGWVGKGESITSTTAGAAVTPASVDAGVVQSPQ